MGKPKRDRAARASSLMVDAIHGAQLQGQRWLVVEEPGQEVASALRRAGAEVQAWSRFSTDGAAGVPEPPAGSYDRVAMRQPRGRDALALALHLVAGRMAPGAELYVYAHNDEGARSTGKALAPLFEAVETLDARRHSRLWRGTRTAAPAQGTLAEHARAVSLDLPGGSHDFTVFPGVFAKGSLDQGTQLLLRALESRPPERVKHALDFACGFGAISAWLARRFAQARVHGVDADAVAVHAAHLSVPQATFAVGDRWSGLARLDAPRRGYDLIASNPPLHQGRDLDLGVLTDLVAGARARLRPRGRLVVVVQSQRPVGALLEEHVGRSKLIAEDGRYRVWEARGGSFESEPDEVEEWTVGDDPAEWMD